MPTAKTNYTQCFIQIDGQHVPTALMDLLNEAVVDSSLHLPSMFTIVFRDPELKWIDNPLFDIGKEVLIKMETSDPQQRKVEGVLIKGEITALEPNFSAGGATTFLVRGYDKSHRLHRGKKTRTFTKQTDDNIVQKIAGEAGLSAEIDPVGITHDYVLQNNQTNMEFLLSRAARLGYQVYAAEGKLYFKKGDAKLGEGPELHFPDGLDTFRPCLTASQQADKIIVKGWDAKGKKPISFEAKPNAALSQGGMSDTGGAIAQKAFGSAEAVVVDQPVFLAAEAQALANGLSNDLSRESLQAEGSCAGDPRIKAGWTIQVGGVGRRFNGTYFITSATHVFNEGYTTHFSIAGRQPNTLSHLLGVDNGHEQSQGLMRGVVTGLVTNLNDPDNLGRVKVKYAWLGEIESDWMRIATPMAGKERGFFYLPEVNDEVLVAFEHGNVNHPYIVGFLWNNQDKPPKPNSEVVSGGIVNQRVLVSRSGHTITLDDSNGKEQISICDKTGNNKMVIASAQNSMTIEVAGDFTVKAKGKINLEATGDVVTQGSNVNITGQPGNVTVKGTTINLN